MIFSGILLPIVVRVLVVPYELAHAGFENRGPVNEHGIMQWCMSPPS